MQFQNKTTISRARERGVAENEIKKEKKTISRIQTSEKEIEKLEAEIMFCLIKNPTFINEFKAELTNIDFSDEFFEKSLWKIQHEPLSTLTDIFYSISALATQKNPPLKNHLVYNDQNKKEM